MKWVTRERPKIDRIACPWLIARFIDPAPEFLYVPGGDVLKVAAETGATPYDVPGVDYGHHGDQCSFDAFIERHKLTPKACPSTSRTTTRCSDTAWCSTTRSTPGAPAPP